MLGVVAALAFLVRGPAVTAAILGAAFMIVGNVLFTAYTHNERTRERTLLTGAIVVTPAVAAMRRP